MTELEDRPVVARDNRQGEGLTMKEEHKVIFLEGDGAVLSLDCGGCVTICIYQISENKSEFCCMSIKN